MSVSLDTLQGATRGDRASQSARLSKDQRRLMASRPKLLAALFVFLLLCGYALWHLREQEPTVSRQENVVASTDATQPASALTGSNTAEPRGSKSEETADDKAAKALTPLQRFALSTNYKDLYDELSRQPDLTGESGYVMGKAVAACNFFFGLTLDQLEKNSIFPGTPNYAARLAALREMGAHCKDFYGFKGPTPMQLWKEAATKGYVPALAASLSEFDRAKAEAAAAEILEGGNPEALERLVIWLQMRAQHMSLEVDGQRASPEVVEQAWRLYACSRGADCYSYLFDQCWQAGHCSHNFQVYLRDFRSQIQPSVIRLEAQIARAVTARDWRALGIVTTGSR